MASPSPPLEIKPLIGLAGILVATMTVDLNAQVTLTALPDITGGLSLGRDPASWLQTLYSAGEAFGMVMAPWWAMTVGLRRFGLFAIALCCATSVLIPLMPSVALVYGLRALQGMAEGFTVPLLMTTALRVLSPPIRLYGLAAYALTATFFPYLGPTLAALWVDVLDWRFAFFQALPFCALAAVLTWYGLPQEPPKLERLKQFDWSGALLMGVGFSSLAVLLTQGDRLDWFASPSVGLLALASGVAIPLFLLNEWFHPLPFIKLQLLGRRNLAYGVVGLILFLLISLGSSELPLTYLEQVQGFRPLQAHTVTLLVAMIQLLTLPLMAVALDVKWLDPRIPSFVGLVLIIVALVGEAQLDSAWQAPQFFLWQSIAAVGAPMVVMPLLMMATNSVKPQEGPFASALVNGPRAIAEVGGVLMIALIERLRGTLHADRLAERLGMDRFPALQAVRGAAGALPPMAPAARPKALQAFAREVQEQVTVLTLADGYLIVAGVAVLMLVILLVLPVRTYPPRIQLAD